VCVPLAAIDNFIVFWYALLFFVMGNYAYYKEPQKEIPSVWTLKTKNNYRKKVYCD
jgi:hypothetical protein